MMITITILLLTAFGERDAGLIDRAIESRAALAQVELAPLADDAEFLRRATLDLTGVVPTVAELEEFLADGRPDKRSHRIDALIASERCTTRLARFLLQMTTENRATYVWFANLYEYLEWLKDSVRAGRTYDRIVSDILAATGQTNVNGATNFVMFHRARADRIAAGAATTFLGSSLACAQCHDHPPYTREQFWGVAAFFARTNTYIVSNGDHGIAEARFGRISMPPPDKPEFLPFAFSHEEDDVPVEARWLDGRPAESEEGLREQLAEFLVRDPAFSRNLVNRLWRHLFGRALVEPVDDLEKGLAGDGARAELLQALADDFVEHGHDLRALLRRIANSRAYQRSCRCSGPAAATCDEQLFAHALPRLLDVDQLLATLEQVAGIDFAVLQPAPASKPPVFERPPSRADLPMIAGEVEGIAPDPTARRAMFDPREIARIEKYKVDAMVPQLFGGESGTIGHVLVRQNLLQGVCARLASSAVARFGEPIDARHLRWLWHSLLSRTPATDEIAEATALLARPDVRPDRSLADVAWALLNSAEFSHNH